MLQNNESFYQLVTLSLCEYIIIQPLTSGWHYGWHYGWYYYKAPPVKKRRGVTRNKDGFSRAVTSKTNELIKDFEQKQLLSRRCYYQRYRHQRYGPRRYS